MHEWEVVLTNGKAIVWAERWLKSLDKQGNEIINFYQSGRIIKQFASNEVVSVQKTYPEEGEIIYNG